jgi:hypothetical protein
MAEDEGSSAVNPAAAASVDGADNGVIRAEEEAADSMNAAAVGVAQDDKTIAEGEGKDRMRAIMKLVFFLRAWKICHNILLVQVEQFFVLFFTPIGWSPTMELL